MNHNPPTFQQPLERAHTQRYGKQLQSGYLLVTPMTDWVFARPQLYEPFLALAHDVRLVHLVCSAGELESRLHQRGDVALLDFALDRQQLIEALDFPRIDTTTKSPVEVAALLDAYMSGLP